MDIAKSGNWKPALGCGISEQIPVYTLKYNAFFEKNNYFFTRARLIVEGGFVKLFPCITSSIFTGLMLRKLKKSMSSSSSKSKADRTSFLAIFISISFIITEFPIGVVDLYKAIWAVDSYKYGNWSQANVGWIMVLVVCVVSGLQTTFYQSRWVVVENRSVPLPLICADFQNIYSSPQFSVMLSSFFTMDEQIVMKSYLMVDAILTKFLPCIAFSILTILLVRFLQKLKPSVNNTGRKNQESTEERKDLTTKLIVFLTFTFFLTEAPLGVIYLVKVFYRRNDPISILSTDFVIYFTVLVTVNSILHPIFCVFMSSQYRNTIRTMCGVTKKAKTPVKNKTSAVSVQGIQMT
ncbi:unnamed protein product [Caenorhabditis nigoni]